MTATATWTATDARRWIAPPGANDDKYTRGVLGVVTGSERYPGAAVLGTEAAHRTGVGMVRFIAPRRVSDLVLARRPEVVPGAGRVQAWLLGSGQDASERSASLGDTLRAATGGGEPLVLDAGALDIWSEARGPAILTPHAGELATLVTQLGESAERADVERDPVRWARVVAERTGASLLLKGSRTVVTDSTRTVEVRSRSHWLATAGTGDVLAGILGALVATHADQVLHDPGVLIDLGATAAWLHAEAGERASGGGPIAALDVAEAVPGVIGELLSAGP